jgi:tryptophan 2,3-dioxygenase
MATVARVIGTVSGTGRSTGLDYLRKTAFESFDRPLFPELWDVRNKIFDPDRFSPEGAGYV